MQRTGEQYREGIRDGREVWIDGERVTDVTTHPAFKPIVDIKARMYDIQHEAAHRNVFGYDEGNERNALLLKQPHAQQDWWDKWNALDAFFKDIKGVVARVGDETIGEMWSLHDARNELDRIDPRFTENIVRHIQRIGREDLFHVSANTDPKGDRSKRPIDQDPDMLCHVVRETDRGIVIRGAKYETAAAYADQAFLKPTIGVLADEKLSDYALGCIVRMGAPGVKHICRSGFEGRGSREDYPLSNGFDEIDSLMVLDDVLIPWEDVFFLRFTESARFMRGILHRYAAFPFVLRVLYTADMMIGAAMWNCRQTGLEKMQSVKDKLADMIAYREGIRAHLAAAIALAEESPGGLLMPNQSLLYAGRIHACVNLPQIMHIARELCGGQLCVTPNYSTFVSEGTKPWMDKFYTLNENWMAEDRRKLLAFARDLLNSDHAGHRLSFVQFAQAPHFNQLAALYGSFDFSGPLDLVKRFAGLSDRVDAD